jgi:iron(III) transport system permease protein
LREQSGATYEVARALGQGPWGVFCRVGLPLARPAIAAGVALALMETVADYGTVHHFGVQTLTTGIFSTWLNGGNAGGAAQIAGVILMVILLLVALERISRRGNARFHAPARAQRRSSGTACIGAGGGAGLLPARRRWWLRAAGGGDAGAFAGRPGAMAGARAGGGAGQHAGRGGAAALATVAAALFLVYGMRLAGRGTARAVLPLTTLGYAAPGAVLAVGLLFPLAALDHRLADGSRR